MILFSFHAFGDGARFGNVDEYLCPTRVVSPVSKRPFG